MPTPDQRPRSQHSVTLARPGALEEVPTGDVPAAGGGRRSRRSLDRAVAGVVLAAVVAAVVVLIVQNDHEVTLEVFWWSPRLSLDVVVLGAAVLGLVVERAAATLWHRRRRRLDGAA
jgi:uncharacterized integral membrane protein